SVPGRPRTRAWLALALVAACGMGGGCTQLEAAMVETRRAFSADVDRIVDGFGTVREALGELASRDDLTGDEASELIEEALGGVVSGVADSFRDWGERFETIEEQVRNVGEAVDVAAEVGGRVGVGDYWGALMALLGVFGVGGSAYGVTRGRAAKAAEAKASQLEVDRAVMVASVPPGPSPELAALMERVNAALVEE
ncbi:MAG: hypothetical protein AAFP22_09775, partial [Planctomycetota bacterium]